MKDNSQELNVDEFMNYIDDNSAGPRSGNSSRSLHHLDLRNENEMEKSRNKFNDYNQY